MNLNKSYSFVIYALSFWPVIWIPVSFLFESDPRLPITALIAPVAGFINIFYFYFNKNSTIANPWKDPFLTYETIPWIIFWSVVIVLLIPLIIIMYLRKSEIDERQ
jgi:hypothetical protein